MCCAPSLALGVTAVNGDGVCRAPSLALGRVIRRRRGLDPGLSPFFLFLCPVACGVCILHPHAIAILGLGAQTEGTYHKGPTVGSPVVSMSNLMEKEHRSTAKAMTKEFVYMVAEPGSATKY